MTDSTDIIVVGGGVVGLAIAAELAAAGTETLVLEAQTAIGQGVSSRNSEVIHAGIYYPNDSLKAKFCVQGNQALYAYCQSRHVPHVACGKLIVAVDDVEAKALEGIHQNAMNNGVPGLSFLTGDEAVKLEPLLHCTAALHSASTGIVSCHDLMTSLEGDLTNAGGQVVLSTYVEKVTRDMDGFHVSFRAGQETHTITCRILVNAAGLGAQALASRCEFIDPVQIPTLHLCKGSYFSYSKGKPFSRLVYPVPEKNTTGLGVHATIDLGGQTKFGPDVEYIDRVDYDVKPAVPAAYIAAIKRYFPSAQPDALSPAYAGIRPKIQAEGAPAEDFCVQTEADHGIENLVQLFGIESPGLTASLAIAQYVKQQLNTRV